jgi:3-isopropylmalate/(R)-2-methylmalate dehydratase small subunit
MDNRQSIIGNRKSKILRGLVYVVGDNIDTDQIIPAQHLNLVPTIPAEYRKLGALALSGLPADYPPFIKSGAEQAEYGIIVAGRNFGCGSSREHAPIALGAAGIRAIVAESYARIFFRNAIATGEQYPCETAVNLRTVFQTGDEAEIRLDCEELVHVKSGKVFKLKSLGAVMPVVSAGGLFAYARETGMITTQADRL